MTNRHGKLRALFACWAVLALAVGVTACGGDDEGDGGGGGAGGTTAAEEGKEIKFATALFGPKNDKSFNQAAYEGMQAAMKDHPNLKLTATLENRNTQQRATDAVETLAPINDIMIGVSNTFGPVFDVKAPQFPDTYFIDIAGYTNEFHENVTGFNNDWGAPTFIAGAIAATMTKTGTVGYVGGAEIPPTVHGANGFAAGAKLIKPDIKVLSNIVGDFNDVAKAKQATAAQITDGADVIFPFLDAGAAGAYNAGEESGKNPAMFKLTIEDCEAYPNMVGTHIVNNLAATQRMLDEYIKGTLEPGAILLALQEPEYQTLKLCPKYEEDPVVSKVTKETIDKVNSGEVKLPEDAVNPRPKYQYKEGFDGEMINPQGG